MHPYLHQLRKTRRAYARHCRTIEHMRVELRTAMEATPEPVADPGYCPVPVGILEAVFCDPFAADDYEPWTADAMDADAAHVAELVECGDLCGLTIYGTPYRPMEQQ